MRKLPVDFSRAIEIHRRCEDEGELLRVAAERTRTAKRRLNEARAEIDRFEKDYGPEVTSDPRGYMGLTEKPFEPGLAGHKMRQQELTDASAMLSTANARYMELVAEASYWRSLRSKVMDYLRTRFSDRQLPVELRSSEEN